jgi:ATP-grasp ribosomal peptide maturase
MTVLILAREFDPTADAVVAELTAREVPVFRTDLSEFPTRLKLTAELKRGTWTGKLWNSHREVELAGLRSIWRRNPSTYSFPATMTASEQDFAHREAKLGLGGVLASLNALWVNHPNRCADAIFKPYQWKIATECGLHVADTVITNDPTSAFRAATKNGWADAITKALGPSGLYVDGQPHAANTEKLTNDDLADMHRVAVTATTIQEFVPKAHEVRLTVIGAEWFPIEIHASTDATRVDWRTDPSALTYKWASIPEEVADGVARYMKRMHLAMSALDFVVTPGGDWVMLEANVGPQIGWLEAATGAPMADALARLLAEGNR